MSRRLPWRRTCPEPVKERIETALVARIYLLQQTGPTGFVVKEDGQTRTQKVCLGEMQSCTCAAFRRDKDLCVHILWVLLKKLRLNKENPLVYQLSLVEREVNEILYSRANVSVKYKPADAKISSSNSGSRAIVVRKKLDEDDVCPICQDDLLGSSELLTFCRYSCGQNVHIKCMRVWAEHQILTNADGIIRCPLCREDFGSLQSLREEQHKSSRRKPKGEQVHMHLGVTCNRCHVCPITGNCYRCISCVCYHLCHMCYQTPTHQHHSFEWRKGPLLPWRLSTQSRGIQLPPLLIADLQDRELTEDDYDTLLQLDGTSLSIASERSQPEAPPADRPRLSGLRCSGRSFHPLELTAGHFLVARYSCHLCQRPFSVSQKVVQLLCSHWFHHNCLRQWTVHHSSCPVDTQPVRPALQQPSRTSAISQRLRSRRAIDFSEQQPSLSDRLSLSGQQLRLFLPAASTTLSSTTVGRREASERAALPSLDRQSLRFGRGQLRSLQLAVNGTRLQQYLDDTDKQSPELPVHAESTAHFPRRRMTSVQEIDESSSMKLPSTTGHQRTSEGERQSVWKRATATGAIPAILSAPTILQRRMQQQQQGRQHGAQRLLLPSARNNFQGSVQGLSVQPHSELTVTPTADSSIN